MAHGQMLSNIGYKRAGTKIKSVNGQKRDAKVALFFCVIKGILMKKSELKYYNHWWINFLVDLKEATVNGNIG